ncbi:telomeric repeat binding factor a [Limanda limanda]|uniref:telomeric repeat binding factor a n=1 Tax=Limanda limanda TaxID=27771 RepID=UPI0029C8440C|nr:telomeric repeat binding factor a [Limanda limanda]
MAAKATVDGVLPEEEGIVNRWIVDYYLSLALQAFDREQFSDLCSIKHVVDSVLVRSLESTDSMPAKIRVLQFLVLINEGERLDVSSESITPLESALKLLQGMSKDCSLPQQEIDNVCTSVKEMIVVFLIKTNKFDRAKEMLTKHFPKPMVGKKAIFMSLINKRCKTHELIQHIDFRQFKKKMFAFCQRLCPFTVPFLHKAAKQLIDTRLSEQDDSAAGPDEQEQPGPSSTPPINTVLVVSCKHNIIQRTRLEAAYKMLASLSDMRTFAQLEEEVEREEQERTNDLLLRLSPSLKEDISLDSEPDGVFQRCSGSPMEASVADQPPKTEAVSHTQTGSLSKSPSPPLRKRRLYTVARLVVEPDSQSSSQCTVASPEPDTQALEVELPESPTIADDNSQSLLTDNEVTKPSRKPRTQSSRLRSRASTSATVLSTDSEKELPVAEANKGSCVVGTHNQSHSSLRSNSPKSQSGVQSSNSDEEQHESSAGFRTPKKTEQSRVSVTRERQNDSDIIDSSLDSSPSVFRHPRPQTSSTPHKDSAPDKDPSHSKWKQLYSTAKESKETWSDEEEHFPSRKNRLQESTISNSGHRKNKWTESETAMLKEGVEKFGEGNWSKIKSRYSFNGRTNVNLKDRWRTLKKLNMV